MYGGSPIARYRSIEHIGASQKDANDAGRPNENAPHAMHSAMFGYSWKHPDEPPQCGRTERIQAEAGESAVQPTGRSYACSQWVSERRGNQHEHGAEGLRARVVSPTNEQKSPGDAKQQHVG